MSFQHFPGVGTVHLQTVNTARVVPGHERHRWLIKKLLRGQSTTCDKCGCKKTLTREYETRYQVAGAKLDSDMRPACTGVQRPTSPPAQPAPYCNGQCGICSCISSPSTATATPSNAGPLH